MTTYYVGTGGNDSNNGTTWALRKLTLNGAEDIPVAAGDTVYVGAGTYRETLIVDVDGSSGSPISYIGDYDGSHTDGTGGVIRITGSDDDQSATRNNCIYGSKNYRSYTNLVFDTNNNGQYAVSTSGTNQTFSKCLFLDNNGTGLYLPKAGSVISDCMFFGATGIYWANGGDDLGVTVQNSIFICRSYGLRVTSQTGGITVKNCLFLDHSTANTAAIVTNLTTAGQTVTVNNCVFYNCATAMRAAETGEIVENYNTIFATGTARVNTDTGANSITYPPLFDTRWFFEMVNGGSMLTPFDLASYSQLLNVAGTSPTTADMRGTTVQGTQREWGALEYDSTLDIEAGSGGGTSSVKILPFVGKVGL